MCHAVYKREDLLPFDSALFFRRVLYLNLAEMLEKNSQARTAALAEWEKI